MNVDSLAKIFGGYFLKSPQNIYFRENDQTYVDEILCILITEHEYLFSNIVGAKPHPRPPSGPPKFFSFLYISYKYDNNNNNSNSNSSNNNNNNNNNN